MARISYVDPTTIDDPEIRAFIAEAEQVGTPRPEIQLIRAHVPAVIRSFVYTRQAVCKGGIVDHGLKELLPPHRSSPNARKWLCVIRTPSPGIRLRLTMR